MATDRPVNGDGPREPRPITPLPLVPGSTAAPAAADGGAAGRGQSSRDRLLSLAVLIPVAVIGLLPFYWMVTTALTPRAAAIRVPPDLLPFDATFDNLVALFEQAPVFLWAFNSLLVAAAIMVGHIIFDSMAGYAFARKRFRGKAIFFTLIVGSLMIPVHVTLVPRFILITNMGLDNNLLGVIAPSIADVFGIFLMRQFMQSLPTELEEAARVDGANEWQVFWRIVMPLSRPAVATVGIFSFVGAWNAFLWPLIVLSDRELLTLPVGVALLQQEFSSNIGLQMAGAIVGAVPMIVLFLLFQRHFLEGVRVGGVKG